MPIPSFDHNHVLPPHLGSITRPEELSPYPCSTLELCQKFSTSPSRIEILKGLIAFREKMVAHGILTGFQWLNGSFCEDVETREGRPPNDLDLVTFFSGSELDFTNIIQNFKEFVSSNLSKSKYLLDHYPVDYNYHPENMVDITRYWIQLFTHNRLGIWKGF